MFVELIGCQCVKKETTWTAQLIVVTILPLHPSYFLNPHIANPPMKCMLQIGTPPPPTLPTFHAHVLSEHVES